MTDTSQHLWATSSGVLPFSKQKVWDFFLMFKWIFLDFRNSVCASCNGVHWEESSSSFFPPCLPLQNVFKHIDKIPAKSSLSEAKQSQLFEPLLTEQMLLNHLSGFLLDSFQSFQLYFLLGSPAVSTYWEHVLFSQCLILFMLILLIPLKELISI